MRNTVISDTSCLIVLTNIAELDLLKKVYGKISTTLEIASEYGEALPGWIEVVSVSDVHKQQILELQVDKGEASAIALALEKDDCLLILDDYKARKIAGRLGLAFTGTVGVIVKAKLMDIIPSIKPLLSKMKKSGFRVSPEIELAALLQAKE